MTEVTRVPLQPIAKGSLAKLWLGVIVAVLIGAGVAWAAVPKGLEFETLVEGTGGSPNDGDIAFVKYIGSLPDGEEFQRAEESPFPPGFLPDGVPLEVKDSSAEGSGVVTGMYQALKQMEKGGKYRVRIPAKLAYGDTPPAGSPIPAGSDIIFEIELVDFLSLDDAMMRVQALEQAMAAQQGAEGDGSTPGQGPQAAPVPVPVPQN
ncbi:FKBP-type peptidyl-prolyl cis-trans isomerase [Qipengyuania sp. CAU 1752]